MRARGGEFRIARRATAARASVGGYYQMPQQNAPLGRPYASALESMPPISVALPPLLCLVRARHLIPAGETNVLESMQCLIMYATGKDWAEDHC